MAHDQHDEFAVESALDLEVGVVTGRDRIVVVVKGEVDYINADALESALNRAVAAGARQVIADLQLVSFLGSDGLQALVAARRRADAAGAELYVVGAAHCVVQPIRVTGLAGPLKLRARMADLPPAGGV